MAEYIYRLNKKIFESTMDVLKKDIVFTISLVLAIGSCFLYEPRLEYIDFKVIFSLFSLMLVVKAFEELKILDKAAIQIVNKCSNFRNISLVLILLCFISSMLITNDVALITFVPLTLVISNKTKKPMIDTIILQTLAANIGSSLTPMGNPQNIYIYTHYGLAPSQFFKTIGIFAIVGAVWLYILNMRIKGDAADIKLSAVNLKRKREVLLWAVVFCIITASILGFVSYNLSFIITLLTAIIFNKKLFFKVDYILLVTFICFFIFIGNISNVESIYSYISRSLKSPSSVYFASVISSQFISNVPAAILLSNFTDNWKALLIGVDLGGMGTIIASLASLISYKLFIKAEPREDRKYMAKFTVYNFVSLLLLGFIGCALLKL